MRSHSLLALLIVAGCGSETVAPSAPADASRDADDAARVDAPAADAPPVDVSPVDVSPVDVPIVDVPPPPPPPPGAMPVGAACERDDQCMSGVCANDPNLDRVCAQPCRRDEECYPLGATFNCALDHSGGGRWACGEVMRASEDPGNECASDSECLSNACVEGRCHSACASISDCVPGWTCTPFPLTGGRSTYCGHAPITGITAERYTLFGNVTNVDRSAEPVRLIVPPDAVSITWTTQDLGGNNLYAAVSRVQAPDASLLVDLRTWTFLRDQSIRTIPSRYQINSATLPSRDMQTVAPGAYTSSHALLNDRTTTVAMRGMLATALVKRAPGGVMPRGNLLVRAWFVGTRGVSGATATANARYNAALAEMRAIYATQGITFGVVGTLDITGADATRYSIIDSQQELHELFALTGATNTDPVLNLMFVRGISASAGLENAVGIAGAINGPAGINGTLASGVVVGWETTVGRTDIMGQVMAHECGHYLGLWHPVESQAGCTTAAQTMCSPFGGVDAITDTPTGATASRNLMFWQAQGGNTLSAGQGTVLRAHALVR